MEPIEEKTAGGISYLERAGSGAAFVFLHGIGSNAGSYADLMRRLPAGQRAIAWNAPGYLDSKPLTMKSPRAEDYADQLAQFLDNLNLGQATIIGHSLGTLMAAAFAACYPKRVTQLMLAACACGYGAAKGEKLPPKAQVRIDDLALQGNQAFARERAPRLVFEPLLNPEIVARVEHDMSLVNPDGYAQAVHMLATGNLEASLSNVQADTRFIIGINDRVTPEQQTLRAVAARSKADGLTPEVFRIDQAGHAVYQQKPQEFIDALLSRKKTQKASVAEGETQ